MSVTLFRNDGTSLDVDVPAVEQGELYVLDNSLFRCDSDGDLMELTDDEQAAYRADLNDRLSKGGSL